jgi:nucleoside-diphosphate-sugar epimerase
MNILLTGGLGFIGRNFLLLRPKSWQIVCLDILKDQKFQKKVKNTRFYQIDLTKQKEVMALAKKLIRHFDICLHLAANGDPALSAPDPIWDLKATTFSLINTGLHFKINKFIYFSSGAVYDGSHGLISPKSQVQPNLPYAISHQAAEEYVRFFQKLKIVHDYVIIRFFGAYGPWEPPRKIFTKLIKTFAIEKQKEFAITGDGENLIDAMMVDDTINGIVKIIQSQKTNLTIDFCKGDHPTINQLVKEAAKIFGIKAKISHQGQVPEYNKFYASPKEFERQFSFKPKISLEEGMRKLKEHLEN